MKTTKRIVALFMVFCLMMGWAWSSDTAQVQAQTQDAADAPLTITRVEDIGNHSFTVYFSEPIAAMSSFPQMGIRVVKRGTDEVPGRKDNETVAAEWMQVSTCSVAQDGSSLTYTRSLSNPTLVERGINELAYRGSGYVLEFAIQDFASASNSNDGIDCIVAKADANKKLQAHNANSAGVERAVCEITLPAPRILSVQQINTTQFKVNFSQAVTLAGTPNMGFRIVKKEDLSVATRTDTGGVAQWISTSGYSLAQDGMSLIYTSNTASLSAMRNQAEALGSENYAVKFVIIESGGTDDIYAGGGTVGVLSADGSQKMVAGFFKAGANAFAACDLTEWSQPQAAVYRMSDTQFDLVFPAQTAIAPDSGANGARLGLFVIDKTTMKLADFNGGFRQYFSTNYTWNADGTRLTWTTGDTVWAEATAAAATNENYEVVFGVIDPSSGLDGVMDNMTLVGTGEYYAGNAVGSASDRMYVSVTEPTVPQVESVQQIAGDRKYRVTFSEAVDITGTPNIGFAVVDENDQLASSAEQYISNDAARIAWAQDHRSFVWTADAAWYSGAVAKAQARGENYRVRFVLIDATGTQENGKIDNVVGRAFQTTLTANYSPKTASERLYADIILWTPATITQVKQLDSVHFRVTFSEAVEVTGTPNIGLAVVDANYALASPAEQYISTDTNRITWSQDGTSFVWRADDGWYGSARTKAKDRGDGYSVQFVMIENNADQSNQTMDNLVSKTTGEAGKATTYAPGVNARMYHDVIEAQPPVITQVKMLDEDTFRIIFDRPTQLVGTPNIGLAVVRKSDHSLGTPIQQHISKETSRISWSADCTEMTWSGMDNIYQTALSQAAARGDDYTVKFFFGEDGTMDTTNYTMDHLVSIGSGDAISATTRAAGTNARVYADIAIWNPPTVVAVRQSSATEFAVAFSDAVYINGTPNIGFAVVKASDHTLDTQYIDTATSRYRWSEDHKTLYWTGGIGWWDAATARQAALGEDYALKFVFVENAGNKMNRAVDNLTGADGQRLAATTSSLEANARLYADIVRWEGPYIERVDQKSETKYQIHFSEPVNIAQGTRVGMFVINTVTNKLVNFADSIGYRQIFTSLSAQSNVTDITFELAENRLEDYRSKAAESANYAVVIGFIDQADSGQNGAINAITAVSDGEMLTAGGYEATDRVYMVPTDVAKPHIQAVNWTEGATFTVTFSEPVTVSAGTRMGLFIVDRGTGRLINFGTESEPQYEQMFNADRYEWVNDTTLVWVCGGSYATIAAKAAANANYAVQFGILDTVTGQNGVVDCIVSQATGEALAATAKEASDRAYAEILGIHASESYVGTSVSPSAEAIRIDGTVNSGEWGDAVIVTNPIDAQMRWNGWIAHDPSYVDYNQTVNIYLSNDDRYIYVAATLDHAEYYAGDSNLLTDNVNFTFSLSRYEEDTTFARVHSLKKEWERYTAYGLALIDGQAVVRCSNQKIDYDALDASDYAVRYDDATDTYHFEIRIPYQNTNIDPGANTRIGFSAMLNVGRVDESLAHNGYHITKGCARRGGAENFAHVNQVLVLSLNETPINPELGDRNMMIPVILCMALPPVVGYLLMKRRKHDH